MESKVMKIVVPEGYEIDKEKSTFKNIVFKKVDEVVIKWHKDKVGVEIKAEGEHFVIDAESPSFNCSWDDAMRFFNTKASSDWELPTVKQLQIISKHIDKINEVIRSNDGFKIKGWMWSCEVKDMSCAWFVSMLNGSTSLSYKSFSGYVRAVSAL